MEDLLFEDSLEDIFGDPALLECADNPDVWAPSVCPVDESDLHPEQAASTSKARKSVSGRKVLNKKERENLITGLRTISGVQLVNVVVEKLSHETHMQHFPEREQMLASLLDSSYEDLVTICAALSDIFVCTYIKCNKGREKYAQFQVEWHRSCSSFVMSVDDEHTNFDELPANKLWLALTRSNPREVRNPVMIAITSAIYGYMLQEMRLLANGNNINSTKNSTLQSEPEEVYLRFGGGALADMFKQRYKDMKSKKSSKIKEKVSQEIQVLEWIRRVDKSTLPASLAYRDQGVCTFLTMTLYPSLET